MITTCSKCNKELLTEVDPYLVIPVDNYSVLCYDCLMKNLKCCCNCRVQDDHTLYCNDWEMWELKE